MVTRTTARGEITIPAHLRRKYGTKAGTQIQVLDANGSIVLQPVTPAFVRSLRGSLKGKNHLLKALVREKARSIRRENPA